MTIGFGGASATIASTAQGLVFTNPGGVDDLFSFSGSALDTLTGNTITLSGFTSAACCGERFFPSITESLIDGAAAATSVPTPATLALLGFGLAGIGFCKRKAR
ncbi:MAG: hypothetical protein ACI9DC_004091 [Gammaproteobacteria bacterium]|jgi:hypothetical protein